MANFNSMYLAAPLPATQIEYETATRIVAQLDEKIAMRKSELLVLYSQRNSFSRVFRLPTETLQVIFINLARDYYIRDSGAPISTPPSWVNVSYVCRHWRNVALSCSTLWTYLFITSSRWTEQLLARSKQASLKANANLNEDIKALALCFVEQIMNHAVCIQELCLHIPNYDCYIIPKLSSRAPRLENLKIFVTGAIQPRNSSLALFNGSTPALRTLELASCPISWYSLQLSCLTSLNLRGIPVQFQQNIVDFLATLGCMRNLSLLHLEDSLATATGFLSSAAFHTFQKIDLPHLSRLWLSAPLSTVITLLHCVNIPLKTEARLRCDSEHGSSLDDYASLGSLLAQRLHTSNGPAAIARSLVVRFMLKAVVLSFKASEKDREFYLFSPDSMWARNEPLHVIIHFGAPSTTGDGREHVVLSLQ